MKFKDYFMEPQQFSNNSCVISALQYTKSQAADKFADFKDTAVAESDIEESRVRFGFPPDTVEDYRDFAGVSIWYTGASGKGSLPVWVL